MNAPDRDSARVVLFSIPSITPTHRRAAPRRIVIFYHLLFGSGQKLN
jgi:hypothetical protein